MRWAHDVLVRCDWCEATAKAGRHVAEAGDLEAVRWALPKGWTEQVARPGLSVVRSAPVEVDPFAPASKLAPLLGAPVQAFACVRCTDQLRPMGARLAGPIGIVTGSKDGAA